MRGPKPNRQRQLGAVQRRARGDRGLPATGGAFVRVRLTVRGVEAGESLGAGAELGLAKLVERRVDGFEEGVHVAGIGLGRKLPA